MISPKSLITGDEASLDRRSLLVGSAALAALPLMGCGDRDDRATLRWWSPQAAPSQVRAYHKQIETFEAANPTVRVLFEPTSDEGYPAQLAAAFAAKQPPNLVTHLPSFAAQSYYAQGLIEAMDPVIDTVGHDRFLTEVNRPNLASDGHYAAVSLGSTAVDMLWVRTDLMAEAGITAIPRTWDELRDACRRMQKGAIYGAPLPFASNSMTSLIFIGFIHRAGGQVFTPDLEVALDSQPVYDALDFYRSMREYCPMGATSFGWADSLNAFVSGATATGIYGGRVLSNVARQNPRIADSLRCATYPTISADVAPWTFNDFPGLFIPKGAPHLPETRLLAASLFETGGYIGQLLAAPGHVLPVIRGMTDRTAYRSNGLTTKFAPQITAMTLAAAQGHNLGFESPDHRPNVKAGEIIASNAIAEIVQRVVLSGENAKMSVQAAATRIERIMRA